MRPAPPKGAGKRGRCDSAIGLASAIGCCAVLLWIAALAARFPAGDFLSPEVDYRWDAKDCSDRASFICQDLATGEYSFFGEDRNTKANWPAALEQCVSMGLVLATVHSEEDHARLLSVRQRSGADHADVWIGLNDRTEECEKDGLCFRWAPDNAELQWTAWESDEPRGTESDAPGARDCVMAQPCAGSMDTDCKDTRYVSEGAAPESDGGDATSELKFRRLALALLAVGSCACAMAAMLACASSVISGQALLRGSSNSSSNSETRPLP